jgi:predicted regulator of Ras-like GTPase activity (Roadblock/LC7/MglB family)
MKILRLIAIVMLAAAGAGAHAQRTLVPIVSFENIPVAQVAGAPATADHVAKAFAEAAEEAHWKLVPVAPGELEATYVKSNKHTVVVTVRYDAQKYSVLFKRSNNMNQREQQYPGTLTTSAGGESMAAMAERKQRTLFEGRPESRYIRNDPQAVIHPFYEHWVQDLLERVRTKLQRSA